MKKAILIFISLYISAIVFMPKEQILYTLLNQAAKQRVNFTISDINDYGFFADVKDTTIIYDKIKVLNIEDMKIYPFLLYNRIGLTTIEPKENFSNMLNLVIITANIVYTPLNPFSVSISASTTIGEISGEYDIKRSKIKLLLKPNERFKSFKYKRYFRKIKGGYLYESLIR